LLKTFASLNLARPLQRALDDIGYETPTPIQVQAIPPLLEGRDVFGCAQTGTGKTAAFALPILQHLLEEARPARRVIRALVLSPTRELAIQIEESFADYAHYTELRHLVIFGGVGQNPQVEALKKGVDILVATPGRLLDLQQQGFISLKDVSFLVLDEADRMLDMGFIHDIRKVLRLLPTRRQNLLFSATMPPDIAALAREFMHDPVRVEVTPPATTVERIEQRVMFVDKANKRELLADLLRRLPVERAIVFTRTKHGANRLVQMLEKDGFQAAAIHGNKSQNARQRALDGFKDGDIPVLVATDIAARGIDVDGVSHVFNFDIPHEPESYVHRIGRTARAGQSGVAIAFCDDTEGADLRQIERLIGLQLPVDEEHAWHFPAAIPPLPGARYGRQPQPVAPRQAPLPPRQAPSPRAEPPRAEPPPRRRLDPPGAAPPRQEPRRDPPAPHPEDAEGQDAPRRRRRRGGRGRGAGEGGGEGAAPQAAATARPPSPPRAAEPRREAPAGGDGQDAPRRRRRRGGRGRSGGGASGAE
jgi:ATP-dependent RNA helicase RhlE